MAYNYSSGASNSNQVRPTKLIYPNSRIITNSFGTSGGMNDYLNRIDTIQDTTSGTSNLSGYTYLGSGTVVRITYPQPSVWLDLWGGTSGTFNGFDRFGRITDQRWQNNITGTPVDIDRYEYGYDQNSNRTYKGNAVAHAAGVYLDEAYTYDNLNRLTQMQRGNLSSGVLTGTPTREMDYTLDPTGNWSAYLTKTSGTTDLSQTRAANTVNEITNINASTGSVWVTPLYDPAGNTITMPQPAAPTNSFTATYDAWNQMTSINNSSGSVATYKYDGRGRRIVKYTASTGETRHFYYTDQWQDIEERIGTSTTMDKQYVCGLRYIDELVCRDDATTSPPQRLYAIQDANFNLTSICNTSGGVVERYLFDPYGTRTIMNASWGTITASAYNWSIGHQGLMLDSESELVFNRMRYLHCGSGTFLSRDPVGYQDGKNLYQYEHGSSISALDPRGTTCIISIRCGHAFLAFHHCGMIIDQGGGTIQICNGSGGDTNKINCIPMPGTIAGSAAGSPSPDKYGPLGAPTSLPDSACACLLQNIKVFNQIAPARNSSGPNSNTSLNCILSKCGQSVSFGGGQGIPSALTSPPVAWNHGFCVHTHMLVGAVGAGAGCVPSICDQWGVCPNGM